MAEVVITKAQLIGARACPVYFNSPEWDPGREALVYKDWAETVERLLSTPAGLGHLSFLVGRNLVPMTPAEFNERLRQAGDAK